MRAIDASIWLEMANTDKRSLLVRAEDFRALVLDACQMRSALAELVALKDHKDDQHGKTDDYTDRQSKAWEEACRVLAQASHAALDSEQAKQ